MFGSVATFELRYQLKSPAFWVTFAMFLLLTFGATASDNVQIGAGGNVLANSPYAIAQTLLVMCIFGLFIMTAFVANVVIRDDETGFGPIIHSTRVSRFDYLFGRFSGAFLAGCLVFLSVPLGMMLGSAMPWLDPETVGPFNLGHYAWIFFCLCVPTLFVMAAGFFALATATRSMMWTYVGVIAFLLLYLVTTGYLTRPEFENFVALGDPFGLGAYTQATKYWTATERNTQLPDLGGHILWNRVLWMGIAFALLGVAWKLYSRAAKGSRMAPGKAPDKSGEESQAVGSGQVSNGDPGHCLRDDGDPGRRLVAALGAREIRHGRRRAQPRLHRAARDRLPERHWRALVRRRDLRQHRSTPSRAS